MSHEQHSELHKELEEAAKLVTVGTQYRHYKDARLSYTVLALALREEDSEPCVVYQADYGDKLTWTRPVKSWLAEVEIDGKKVTRFTKLDN